MFALVQAVFKLYSQMEEYRVRPTVDTYNTLLKACMQHGETQQAMTIFKRLRNSRRGPDVVTYTTLINGFSDAGRPAAAVSLCNIYSFIPPQGQAVPSCSKVLQYNFQPFALIMQAAFARGISSGPVMCNMIRASLHAMCLHQRSFNAAD